MSISAMKYRKAPRVAIDCEMVDAGTTVRVDVLIRVSIVDEKGEILYDKYVKPTKPVTDYRTIITGITALSFSMVASETFQKVQEDVKKIIKGKILVGHGLEHDLQVLEIEHPHEDCLDTSRILPYKNDGSKPLGTPALKYLANKYLGLTIQNGPHNPVIDARIAMKLSHVPYVKMSQ